MADAGAATVEMLIEVIHQCLRSGCFDVEHRQLFNAFGQQCVGYRSACTTGAHLYHLGTRRIGQAPAKAFGKTQAVGVVADALAVLEHHGIDCTNAPRFSREIVQQRQDRLLAREGNVQAGVTHRLGCGEQLLQRGAVQLQAVQVDQPVQVIQALGTAFVLMQRRGARGLDACADQAGENAAGGGRIHGETPLLFLEMAFSENVPFG
ncbi:hypothetical protein D3C80_1376100 [compost metagenome]